MPPMAAPKAVKKWEFLPHFSNSGAKIYIIF